MKKPKISIRNIRAIAAYCIENDLKADDIKMWADWAQLRTSERMYAEHYWKTYFYTGLISLDRSVLMNMCGLYDPPANSRRDDDSWRKIAEDIVCDYADECAQYNNIQTQAQSREYILTIDAFKDLIRSSKTPPYVRAVFEKIHDLFGIICRVQTIITDQRKSSGTRQDNSMKQDDRLAQPQTV